MLTGDGAMGTYLYQMGFPVGVSYEEFNLLRPEVIADVHRRYYEAGAQSHRDEHVLGERGEAVQIRAGNGSGSDQPCRRKIARQAVGDDAYVVGAVGSIRAGKRKNIRIDRS